MGVTRTRTVALFSLVAVFLATAAQAGPPERRGLTTTLGGGFGYTRILQGEPHRDFHALVFGPVTASVGGFVGPNWAVQVRGGAHWFSTQTEVDTRRWFSNLYLGSELQHWLRDNVSISAGVGISMVMTEPIEINADRAMTMSIRGTWAFKTNKNNAVSLAWEVRPSVFLNHEVILDWLMLVEWQRL